MPNRTTYSAVSLGVEFWESHSLPITRVSGRLCQGGELPVQRLVVLDMPVLDDQPVNDPHDIGCRLVYRLSGSFGAFAPPGESARDAKMADNTIPYQYLLENLHPAIWKRREEGRPGIGQT